MTWPSYRPTNPRRSTSSVLPDVVFGRDRHGVSEQMIYTWRKRFGSFQPDDVRRLKQLEQENARLKKLGAERDLEIEVMKEIAVKKW
jgi:putative transposase